jgi:hypothetical protein
MPLGIGGLVLVGVVAGLLANRTWPAVRRSTVLVVTWTDSLP